MTMYASKVKHGQAPQRIAADGRYHLVSAGGRRRFPVPPRGKLELEYQLAGPRVEGQRGMVVAWLRDDDRAGLDPTGAMTFDWPADAWAVDPEYHASPGRHGIDAGPALTHVCLGVRVLGAVPLTIHTRIVKIGGTR